MGLSARYGMWVLIFLFSIYSENHGIQAVQLNFSISSDIAYVMRVSSSVAFVEA